MQFLSSLQRFFDVIASGSTAVIRDVLSSLFQHLAILRGVSSYLRSSQNMTDLLVRIANAIIRRCRELICHPSSIFQQPSADVVSKCKSAIALNLSFQEQYRLAKEKSIAERDRLRSSDGDLSSHSVRPHSSTTKRGAMSSAKTSLPFDFGENLIFGRFELFVLRLQQLVEIFTAVEQFDGMRRVALIDMKSFAVEFFLIFERFKSQPYDMLDYTSVLFERDYRHFCEAMIEIEAHASTYVSSQFETLPSTSAALAVLQELRSVAKRATMIADMDAKIAHVFRRYSRDLGAIAKEYESFKEDPPRVRNYSPTVAAIVWSSHLRRRVENPMAVFRENAAIMAAPESKPVFKRHGIICRALSEFEKMWIDTFEAHAMDLRSALHASIFKSSIVHVSKTSHRLSSLRESPSSWQSTSIHSCAMSSLMRRG